MGLLNFLTGGKFVIGESRPPKQVLLTCEKCGRKQKIGGHEHRTICDRCAKKVKAQKG